MENQKGSIKEIWYSMSPEFPDHEISNLKRIKHKAHTTTVTHNYPEKIYAKKKQHSIFCNGKLHLKTAQILVDDCFTETQQEQENEIWKKLDEFAGFEISNKGRLKRLERKTEFQREYQDRILEVNRHSEIIPLFKNNPRRQISRSIRKLHKKYVLKEEIEQNSKKHRRKRTIQF